jgi:hypothetical protein
MSLFNENRANMKAEEIIGRAAYDSSFDKPYTN